jgi:HSP20 family protein
MDINTVLSHLSSAMLNSEDCDLSTIINNFHIPQTDVIVSPRYVTVFIELPGINKNNIKLDFFNNRLDISAIREKSYEDNEIEIKKSEIYYGTIKRKVILPVSVTSKENVNITFNDGLLKIIIDKEQEEKNKFTLNL